jgi:hypothetical protein
MLEGNKEVFHPEDLSVMVFGLQGMRASHKPGLAAFINGTVVVLDRSDPTMNINQIARMLSGLKYLRSDSATVRQLLSAVTEMTEKCSGPVTSHFVTSALVGLRNLSPEHSETRQLMGAITKKVSLYEGEPLSTQMVEVSLAGLRRLDSTCEEVKKLIEVFCSLLDDMPRSGVGEISEKDTDVSRDTPDIFRIGRLSSFQNIGLNGSGSKDNPWQQPSVITPAVIRDIQNLTRDIERATAKLSIETLANIMYGLRYVGMEGSMKETEAVRRLMQLLTTKLILNEDKIDSRHICRLLYGLQSKDCTYPEVRGWVAAVAGKIRSPSTDSIKFNEPSVVDCFHVLAGLPSAYKEVKFLVSELLPKMKTCQDRFQANSLKVLLFGLQSMETDSQEVRGLVRFVQEKVLESEEGTIIAEQSVGTALYGLQHMSTDNDTTVRELLEALAPRLFFGKSSSKAQARVAATQATIALYGLQGCSLNNPVVRDILSRLSSWMVDTISPQTFTLTHVSMAIYGLQNKDSRDASIQKLLVYLATVVNGLVVERILAKDAHSLTIAMGILDRMEHTTEVGILLEALRLKESEYASFVSSQTSQQPDHQTDTQQNRLMERRVAGIARAVTRHLPSVFVDTNSYLHYLEADIVVRRHQGDQPVEIFNFEIDGEYHLLPKKKKFVQLRDEALASRDVKVIRWDHQILCELSDDDIADRFKQILKL